MVSAKRRSRSPKHSPPLNPPIYADAFDLPPPYMRMMDYRHITPLTFSSKDSQVSHSSWYFNAWAPT